MSRFIFSLLLIFILFTACTGEREHLPSGKIEKTVSNPATKTEISNLVPGEVFLFQSTIDTPISYRLARLPGACLLDVTCPEPEIAPQFPETEFSPASPSLLKWSPDGSMALFMNAFNSRLLVLDPANLGVSQLPMELLMVSDQIAWSPDSQWAALEVEGSDAYVSHILLVNPRSHEIRELQTELEGMLTPLAWLDASHLLLLQKRYEDTGGEVDQKKDITGESIYKLVVDNLHSEVLFPDVPLNGDILPALSPDKRLIALDVVRNEKRLLEIYSMDGKRKQSFEEYIFSAWSPDGRWIAAIRYETNGYSVTLLDPEVSEERKLITLDYMPEYVWLPDSLKLIITSTVDEGENETDFLYVVSTSGEILRKIKTSDIVEEDYKLLGISIEPDIH